MNQSLNIKTCSKCKIDYKGADCKKQFMSVRPGTTMYNKKTGKTLQQYS